MANLEGWGREQDTQARASPNNMAFDGAERQTAKRYGELLGLMVQISDDLLDVTESTETLGKTAAKDESVQKITYPSVFGLDHSREVLRSVYAEAVECLHGLARDTTKLQGIADFIVNRRS